jgi:hypothetical protein
MKKITWVGALFLVLTIGLSGCKNGSQGTSQKSNQNLTEVQKTIGTKTISWAYTDIGNGEKQTVYPITKEKDVTERPAKLFGSPNEYIFDQEYNYYQVTLLPDGTYYYYDKSSREASGNLKAYTYCKITKGKYKVHKHAVQLLEEDSVAYPPDISQTMDHETYRDEETKYAVKNDVYYQHFDSWFDLNEHLEITKIRLKYSKTQKFVDNVEPTGKKVFPRYTRNILVDAPKVFADAKRIYDESKDWD